MCGICGVYGKSEYKKTRMMLEAIKHRGPDGNKIVNYQWGSLGFCRLEIFGPTGINQPAISDDKKTTVVFNGEIYNFEGLKSLLGTNKEISDEATLILELFLKYGEKGFKKLKGMFAIAVMTPEKLILVRDPVGIKPLVYYLENGKIFFASEIKALLRIKENMVEIDKDALAETAVFGFIFDLEKTMFKGIKQLHPGSYLCFEKKRIKIKKFCELKPAFYGREVWQDTKTSDKYEELMDIAAKLHSSHSKYTQAIYLSGGLDSTLMTYFIKKNSSKTIDTFTLFDDIKCEDRIYASKIAKALGTSHHEYQSDMDECLIFLDHYLYYYESLVTNGIFNVLGSLAFHLLAHKISKKHKVAYCGEGADELFGGYYWLHAHPLGVGDRLRARSAKINNGKTLINEFIMYQFPDDDSKEEDMKRKIFDFLMGPGLTNCHLWSVDRSSSAFSFEARPLYLYDEIREWALSLSIENKVLKSKDLNTKLILKKFAMDTNNSLIYKVSTRKKIGMPSALGLSLEKLVSYAEENFRGKNKSNLPHQEFSGFFNSDLEKLMFDKFYQIFVINRGKSTLISSCPEF